MPNPIAPRPMKPIRFTLLDLQAIWFASSSGLYISSFAASVVLTPRTLSQTCTELYSSETTKTKMVLSYDKA